MRLSFTDHAVTRFVERCCDPQTPHAEGRARLEAAAGEATRIRERSPQGDVQWDIASLGARLITVPGDGAHVVVTIVPIPPTPLFFEEATDAPPVVALSPPGPPPLRMPSLAEAGVKRDLPPPPADQTILLRCEGALLQALDEVRARWRVERPGPCYSRAEVARLLLWERLLPTAPSSPRTGLQDDLRGLAASEGGE
jgi:hypothetical protein